MDYYDYVVNIETNSTKMTTDTLLLSIEHLYNSLNLLTDVNNEIVDSLINAQKLITNLSNSWLEVNKCRIYTESFDEKLIPAMGLINDAKCMLESLIVWKLGLTIHGKYNILKCIREAILDYISPVLTDLEYILDNSSNSSDELIKCVMF